MEKQELVKEFDKMLPILRELETKNNELERVQHRMDSLVNQYNQPVNPIMQYGVPIVICAFSTVIIGGALAMFLNIFGFAIGLAVGIFICKKMNLIGKMDKQNAERQQQLEVEAAKVEVVRKNTAQEIYDFLQPYYEWMTSIIPERYAYTYCVEKLREYLVLGRADNLKEAINLYETELHQMRMQQQMDAMMEEVQEQSRQIYALRQEVAEANWNAQRAAAAANRTF